MPTGRQKKPGMEAYWHRRTRGAHIPQKTKTYVVGDSAETVNGRMMLRNAHGEEAVHAEQVAVAGDRKTRMRAVASLDANEKHAASDYGRRDLLMR